MSRRTSSQVFVGRNAELGRLDEALADAIEGRPSIVLVAGEAGIGKTRFVSEFGIRATGAGAVLAVGGCMDVADGGLPYAPFVEAFRSLGRQLDAPVAERMFEPSHDLLGVLETDPRRANAFDGRSVATALEDPADRLARLFDGVLRVLGHLSNDRPVVLILEDLHWADGSTRDLIRFLVRNVRDEHLLMVATYRSDDLHRRHPVIPLLAELARAEDVQRIELRRLDREELDQLLIGILGVAPSRSVGDALLRRSDGLPFYIEELVASTSTDRQLPSTLRDILEHRLVVLPAGALKVVQTAAVIGGRPTHERLAMMTGLDPTLLMDAVREACDCGILTPGNNMDDPDYGFRHALLREAAYDDLLPAERVRLHGKMAELLEAAIHGHTEASPATLADFARHAYLAHDLPRALEGAARAMSAFVGAIAYREALAHAERALELWPRVSDAAARVRMDRAHLLASTGRLAAAAGQPSRATALLREAITELDERAEPSERVALLAELQATAWETEDFETSREAAEAAYELGMSAGPSRLQVEVMYLLSNERWWSGRVLEAASILEATIELAERIDDGGGLADSTAFLAHVRSDLGQGVWASNLIDRSAAPLIDRAEGSAGLAGGPGRLVSTDIDRSIAALVVGRFADAERFASSGLELAIRYGLELRRGPHLRACLLDALFELGRYDDAETLIRQLEARQGISHARNWLSATISRVWIARGRPDEVRGLENELPTDHSDAHLGPVWDQFSFSRLAQVDLARLEGRFLDVVAIVDLFCDAIPTTEAVMPTWQVLALGIGSGADEAIAARRRRRPTNDILAHTDRWYAALTGLDDRVGSQGGGGPWFDATIVTATAEMGRLRDRSDPSAWSVATDRWVALHHPFQTAYARLRLGEAILHTGGERSSAATELRSAYAIASSIGAGRLLPEIEAVAAYARVELSPERQNGSDAAVPATTGLTPRERDVLRLVAAGHTNREIGDQLFISEKTVSVHVSNAMAKLGALSRYEAAAAAQGQGLI